MKLTLCLFALFSSFLCFSKESEYEVFEYNNHKYIKFDKHCVMHDPDCTCKNLPEDVWALTQISEKQWFFYKWIPPYEIPPG